MNPPVRTWCRVGTSGWVCSLSVRQLADANRNRRIAQRGERLSRSVAGAIVIFNRHRLTPVRRVATFGNCQLTTDH